MKLKDLVNKMFKVAMNSVKLISAKTEDGTIVTFDVFEVESPIFSVNEDASVTPLEDDEYTIIVDEMNYKVVVTDGMIASIEEVVEEPEVETPEVETPTEMQEQQSEQVEETVEVDEKIKEFEAKLSEKETEISELKLKIEEYEEKLKTALPQPKKNEVKTTSSSYIKEDAKARLSAIQSLKK